VSDAKGVSAEQLGAALTKLGLISAPQWAAALQKAGGPTELSAALDLLGRTPAHWAPQGDRSPALTLYQRGEIDAALKAGSLKALPGVLVWNDYLILEMVGKGGMGKVYKGWDRKNLRFVAVKKMLEEFSNIGEALKRQNREAEVLTSLDHPFLARLYSREKLGGDHLLVMEYVFGTTLSSRVQQRYAQNKCLPWPVVAKLAADLLGVLAYLHGGNRQGETILHRDIKPANIMVQDIDGGGFRPVLLDMGLAKVLPKEGEKPVEELTRQFQILGTPEYMPPEQWNGAAEAVPMSDVYALGGTLAYALTGEPPFGSVVGGTRAQVMTTMIQRHTKGPRPDPRAKRPDVPDKFADLIVRMTAVDPAVRGPISELQAIVAEVLADPRAKDAPTSTFVAPPKPAPPPPPPTSRPSAPSTAKPPAARAAGPAVPHGGGPNSPRPGKRTVADEIGPVATRARAAKGGATAVAASGSSSFGLTTMSRSLVRPDRNPVGLLFVVALGVLVGLTAGWAWAGAVALGAVVLAIYGLAAGGE
jgi:serine/threonine protein kinase